MAPTLSSTGMWGSTARHAEDVEPLDAEILQAVFQGFPQIARIAAAAHAFGIAVARAAALRVNDDVLAPAADRFANQAVIVAPAVARRAVEKIDAEIERAADGGD
jgi:hypothetical protein